MFVDRIDDFEREIAHFAGTRAFWGELADAAALIHTDCEADPIADPAGRDLNPHFREDALGVFSQRAAPVMPS